MKDHINPSHYKDIVPGFEYMDMMTYMLKRFDGVDAHLMGQVYKYLMRAGNKDPLLQDLKKAKWYLDRLIAEVETYILTDDDDYLNLKGNPPEVKEHVYKRAPTVNELASHIDWETYTVPYEVKCPVCIDMLKRVDNTVATYKCPTCEYEVEVGEPS